MPRYAAFLRGVMPTNCKMPALKRAFEEAGFAEVRTVLGSGNVAFDARTAARATLEARIEAAAGFPAMVRAVDELEALLAADPFAAFDLPSNAKRVVTFLRKPARAAPPPEEDGARILRIDGDCALSAYVPGPKGPVFMKLIEKTFGKDVTTRTLETVRKVAAA